MTDPGVQNVVGPLGVTVGVAAVFAVTAVGALVAVQPFAAVTVTL